MFHEWAQYLPARYKGVERLLVSFGPGTEEGRGGEDGASRTIGLVAEGDSWSPVVEAVAGVLEQGALRASAFCSVSHKVFVTIVTIDVLSGIVYGFYLCVLTGRLWRAYHP